MAKRDYVAEIASRRGRLRKRAPRHDEVYQRVDEIIAIAQFIAKARTADVPFRAELAKYVPIGMVACLEGYFRLAFRDLIDHGPPFRDRVAAFADIKISLEQTIALQSKRVTLGEFVAHLLPTRTIEDIDRSMSTLLGESFLERIKTASVDFFGRGPVSLESEDLVGVVFEDLRTLFEHRHIFAHELATKLKLSPRRLAIDGAAATILIAATEAVLDEVLGV